jgi:hypothetical protein
LAQPLEVFLNLSHLGIEVAQLPHKIGERPGRASVNRVERVGLIKDVVKDVFQQFILFRFVVAQQVILL